MIFDLSHLLTLCPVTTRCRARLTYDFIFMPIFAVFWSLICVTPFSHANRLMDSVGSFLIDILMNSTRIRTCYPLHRPYTYFSIILLAVVPWREPLLGHIRWLYPIFMIWRNIILDHILLYTLKFSNLFNLLTLDARSSFLIFSIIYFNISFFSFLFSFFLAMVFFYYKINQIKKHKYKMAAGWRKTLTVNIPN